MRMQFFPFYRKQDWATTRATYTYDLAYVREKQLDVATDDEEDYAFKLDDLRLPFFEILVMYVLCGMTFILERLWDWSTDGYGDKGRHRAWKGRTLLI